MTYRCNRFGKRRVHIFHDGDRHSWCGYMLDHDTDESTAEEFALRARACNACRKNALGDKRGACAKCGINHLSLSRITAKARIGYLRKRDGDNCGLCGLPLADDLGRVIDELKPNCDHIIERRNGGCSHPANIRLAHTFCNGVRENYPDPRRHPRFDLVMRVAIRDAMDHRPRHIRDRHARRGTAATA